MKILHSLLAVALLALVAAHPHHPTKQPTPSPTTKPTTRAPTISPTTSPPTTSPTTSSPTAAPTTSAPTTSPSSAPTSTPTTSSPTAAPTTSEPTASPSLPPTSAPTTSAPTSSPTTSAPTSSPTTSSPTAAPTTSEPTVSPSLPPTSTPTTSAPTSSPTTSAPTSSPTTSAPTTSPSSAPTASPTTSAPTITHSPTGTPTYQPTVTTAEHIILYMFDTHGDGWNTDLYMNVENHHDDAPDRRLHEEGTELYDLHCSCKVVRLFDGDLSISMWRNRTVPGPKGDYVPYEWEALWTIAYSDGIEETVFDFVGGVDTVVELHDFELVSLENELDTDETEPSNMCVPPKPKPKAKPSSIYSTEDTDDAEDTSRPKPKPSPTVDVPLTLMTTYGISWCDDSGDTHPYLCSKESELTPDLRLPNLLLYPRYYISRTDDNKLVTSGTMRTNETEWVTSVKMLREGSYVFSVSGHYTAPTGEVTWDFCGEQGGISERLHFDMVKSECKAHYLEELESGLTCDDEWESGGLAANPIQLIDASNDLKSFRAGLHVYFLVGVACVVAALVVAVVATRQRRSSKFVRLDTTEHA